MKNLKPHKAEKEEPTDISYLGVLHDEFVHGQGGDPKKYTGDDHGDYSWDPS